MLSCLVLCAAQGAWAQDAPPDARPQAENVRFEYAQVLAVDPVYQVQRTTRTERMCEEVAPVGKVGFARMLGAVKDTLGPRLDQAQVPAGNCRTVPVTRDFRRPVAYDVDYAYKGSKYRTRMSSDPGNRLRIRVSVTPQPMAGP